MKHKHLLLIIPQYFGYENYLIKEFASRGYRVHSIYENLDNLSIYYRFIIAFTKTRKNRALTKYYLRKIKEVDYNIEKIIVIRGSTITAEVIDEMEAKWPNAELVMYQWDSVKNNYNAKSISNRFNRVLTFDMEDARELGWKYRPLFFIPELCDDSAPIIDFSFICMLHSERFVIFSKLKAIEKKMELKGYYHLFTFRVVYLRHKYLIKDPAFKDIKLNDICFKSLSLEETNSVYNHVKVVVDYTHPNQSGFTMRTIESLGHGCSLITNNKKVLDADFYDPNSIFIYEGTDVDIPEDFLIRGRGKKNKNFMQSYSIQAFVSELLGE